MPSNSAKNVIAINTLRTDLCMLNNAINALIVAVIMLKSIADDWKAFRKVLPPERHVVGKSGTTTIEQNNSNTRRHLGRMARRIKIV
jgi:IS1 family transposase